MSSAVAKPDSIMRIADSRYGMSSAFTTKPARSCERITFLLSTSVAKASARAVVSGDVSRLVTTSTSRSTGTGLKKWMPMTCSGRFVAIPSFITGIDDVFDARTACSSTTTWSSAANTSVLRRSSSITASTTS